MSVLTDQLLKEEQAGLARGPAYKALVEKGMAAVPELLNSLRSSPSRHVISALEAITGRAPYGSGADINQQRNGWLNGRMD